MKRVKCVNSLTSARAGHKVINFLVCAERPDGTAVVSDREADILIKRGGFEIVHDLSLSPEPTRQLGVYKTAPKQTKKSNWLTRFMYKHVLFMEEE